MSTLYDRLVCLQLEVENWGDPEPRAPWDDDDPKDYDLWEK